MAQTEQAIFTNMCMIDDGQGNVLVQNRVDPHWPGICFPGGHVEPGESFVASVIREVQEETGLTIRQPVLCGAKQWQTEDGARYVVLFYKANQFQGQLRASDEGEVFWVPRNTLHRYPLAQDFADMLRIFEDDTLSEFYYYKQEDHWAYTLL